MAAAHVKQAPRGAAGKVWCMGRVSGTRPLAHPAHSHGSNRRMYRVRQQDLPFQGSSHQFVGANHGDVGISVFLLSALPGRGPGPHRHPYDEVQFIREGRGL